MFMQTSIVTFPWLQVSAYLAAAFGQQQWQALQAALARCAKLQVLHSPRVACDQFSTQATLLYMLAGQHPAGLH